MMATKPFRLMDLPRELRDDVYRELLLPRNVRCKRVSDKKRRLFSFQPAILRVCKQTYQESSRVLYKETNWVLITSSVGAESKSSFRDFEKLGWYPIFSHNSLIFPGTLFLRMEMSGSLDTDHKYQESMLIPRHDFQLYCGLLAPNHACTTLRFNKDAMQDPSTREVRTFQIKFFPCAADWSNVIFREQKAPLFSRNVLLFR